MRTHPRRAARMSEPKVTGSLESVAARAVVTLPTAWRVFTGIGSFASTALLVILSFVGQTVRAEWVELRAELAEIRIKLAEQPAPEEFKALRAKVEQINEKVIRIEARFDE